MIGKPVRARCSPQADTRRIAARLDIGTSVSVDGLRGMPDRAGGARSVTTTLRPIAATGWSLCLGTLPAVCAIPFGGCAQAASGGSGRSRSGASEAALGGWPDFVELETLRRELNL